MMKIKEELKLLLKFLVLGIIEFCVLYSFLPKDLLKMNIIYIILLSTNLIIICLSIYIKKRNK